MTNKLTTAPSNVQRSIVRYTDLRMQAVQADQLLMEELAQNLFRTEEILDRMEYRLNSQATAARRVIKEGNDGHQAVPYKEGDHD